MKSWAAASFFCVVLSSGCTAHNPEFLGVQQPPLDLGTPACNPMQVQTDPRHCGSCDNDCTRLPNVDPARVTCVLGVCGLANACLSGYGDCTAAPGCETLLDTADHCGACARVCSGATPLCVASGASFTCSDHCPSTAPDQCGTTCVNQQTDPQHCGGCSPCPTPTNGQAVCNAGLCDVTCDSGFHDCGGECVSNTSAATCGLSCTPCSVPTHGTATCDGTSCGFVCDSGYQPSGSTCVPINGGTCNPACGSGTTCVNGACCGLTNNNCMNNTDCCSGNCQNPFLGFGTCGCNNVGTSCSSDAVCCTSKCGLDGKCACLPVGMSGCGIDGDCCYGTCNTQTGQCACAATGKSCGTSTDCCSGICTGSTCQCKSSGTCTADGDCCSLECVSNNCRQCVPSGGTVSSATQCCSGVASGSTCVCAAVSHSCQNNNDCCSGNCVNNVCACTTQSGSCKTASDCCYGTCNGTSCTCKAANVACTTTSECCFGNECSPTLHTCQPCGIGGAGCGPTATAGCCGSWSYTCGTGQTCCGQAGALCSSGTECCGGTCSTTTGKCL